MPTQISGTTGVSQVQDNTIDSNKIVDGTITNTDINNTAAIEGTKIATNFGSQNITIGGADISITNTDNFNLSFGTNNTERMRIWNNGVVRIGNPNSSSFQLDFGGTGTVETFRSAVITGDGTNVYLLNQQNGAILFGTNNVERVRILNNGFVGINTTTPSEQLGVNGNISAQRIRLTVTTDASLASTGHAIQVGATNGVNLIIDNNEIMARNNGASEQLFLNGDGGPNSLVACGGNFRSNNLAGTGTRNVGASPSGILVISTSDGRLKKDITPVSDALHKISNLQGVYYKWVNEEENGSNTCIGLIAQDVKDVVPELVFERNDGMYGVHYDQIGPLLINAVKELKQQLDAALERISELESK
jgi:hypothetical protein